MFLNFFFLLRDSGLKVSLNEWMTLLEALEKGLHHSSMLGFYRLCSAVLVKRESDADRFDQVFLEYFGAPKEPELPPELLAWLTHPTEKLQQEAQTLAASERTDETLEEILEQLRQRLQEQNSEHNGGNHYVGTGGTSPFGNSGWHPGGIRIGGEGQYRTAGMVAGQRRYRDFRGDNRLDTRQFQQAFRILRQMTLQNDAGVTELDLKGTIRETCNHGGLLQVAYQKPRKNNVKVLLLMDSGGSMEPHAELCSMLFQAAVRSNHLKEVHICYFHNTIYGRLYTQPVLWSNYSVPTDQVLEQYDSSYKVIIVGDAAMDPDELNLQYYDRATGTFIRQGMRYLDRFRQKYPDIVWLNPEPEPEGSNYWTITREQLAAEFPMYPLTADGLTMAMKKLMAG